MSVSDRQTVVILLSICHLHFLMVEWSWCVTESTRQEANMFNYVKSKNEIVSFMAEEAASAAKTS